MVGDRWLDVACGRAAGVRALLVRTGHGAHEEAHAPAGRERGCYPQQFDGGRWVDSAQLLALVGALRGRTVAVIGDVVADEFVYGRVARVSREAPVLILEYDSTEIVPGGAGNAANNVAALGGRAALVAVGRTRRAGAAAARGAASRASTGGGGPRGRPRHAGEDAHPGRRHPLGQAAGGAHRSRRQAFDRCARRAPRSSARRSRRA